MTDGAAALPNLSVQSFAACEVGRDTRLVGAAVDADTVYLVLAGTMHMTVSSGSLVARAGSLVLVPTGMQPSIAASATPSIDVVATRERLAQRGGILVFDAAQGHAGALRVMVGRVRGELSAILGEGGRVETPIAADMKGIAFARSAYATLRQELDSPGLGLPQLAATLTKACVLLFVRALHDHAAPIASGTAGNRIAAVAATIQARPCDSYSVASLAALAGMSRATFARQFQRHSAMTPMEFVLATRLREAASLLRTTSLPIKQVASGAGFQSRSHFSRAFHASFGQHPTDFRTALSRPSGADIDETTPMLPGAGA